MYRGLTKEQYNIYNRIPTNGIEMYEELSNKNLSNDNFIEFYKKAKEFYETKLKDNAKFNNLPIDDRREAVGIWLYEGKLPHWANDEKFDSSALDEIREEMLSKQNIVKKVCTELGITQKELAEKLATSKPTVERWSSTGEIPESSKKHLEILLENEELKKENQEIKKALSILKKYS